MESSAPTAMTSPVPADKFSVGFSVNSKPRARAYIAGPMRGLPYLNTPAFNKAAVDLRNAGYEVFNPAFTDDDGKLPLKDYMAVDLPEVCKADVVYVLDGWEDSEGARLEVTVALQCGIRVRTYPGLREVVSVPPVASQVPSNRHPNSARFHELLKIAGDRHDEKQADYGLGDDPFANVRASEEWGIAGWTGAMIRLNDKVRRLQSFAKKGTLNGDSADNDFIDIAVYALIAYVLWEQGNAGS